MNDLYDLCYTIEPIETQKRIDQLLLVLNATGSNLFQFYGLKEVPLSLVSNRLILDTRFKTDRRLKVISK